MTVNEMPMQGEWPDGSYIMDVIRSRHRGETIGGWQFIELTLGVRGTNAVLRWLVVSSPQAAWTWEDVASAWDEVPSLVGRSFLVKLVRKEYQIEQVGERKVNQVVALECEVFPDGAPVTGSVHHTSNPRRGFAQTREPRRAGRARA